MSNGTGDLSYRMTMEEDVSPKLAAVAAGTEQVTAAANKTASAASVMAAALQRAAASTDAASSSSTQAAKGFDKAGVSLKDTRGAAVLAAISLNQVASAAGSTSPAAKLLADSLGLVAQGIRALGMGAFGLIGMLVALAGIIYNTVVKVLEKKAAALKQISDNTDTYYKMLKKLNDAKLDKIAQEYKNLQDAAEKAAAAQARINNAKDNLATAGANKVRANIDLEEQNALSELAPGDKAGREAIRKKFDGRRLNADVQQADSEAAVAVVDAQEELSAAQKKVADAKTTLAKLRKNAEETRAATETPEYYAASAENQKTMRDSANTATRAYNDQQSIFVELSDALTPLVDKLDAAKANQEAVSQSGDAALKDFANQQAEELAATTVDALKNKLAQQKEEITKAGSDKLESLDSQIDAAGARIEAASQKADDAKSFLDKWGGNVSGLAAAKSAAAAEADKPDTAQGRMGKLMNEARRRMRMDRDLRGSDVTDLNEDQLHKLGLTKGNARALGSYMAAEKDVKTARKTAAAADAEKKKAADDKAKLEKARDEQAKIAADALDNINKILTRELGDGK